jgi:hypothetical protein
MNMELIYENENGKSVIISAPSGSAADRRNAQFVLTGARGLYATSAAIQTAMAGEQTVLAHSVIKPREIRIEGIIMEQVAYNRSRLAECMAPRSPGWLRLRRAASERRITCVVREAPVFDIANGARFAAELLAPSPFWEASEGSASAPLSGWVGHIEFPFEIIETFEFGSRVLGVTVDIINPGDVPTGMVVRMIAAETVENPQVLRTDTGESMRLLAALQAGDTFTISTGANEKYASIRRANGTIENAMPALDPQTVFLSLIPGDNLLRVSADSGEEALEAEVLFRARYISA